MIFYLRTKFKGSCLYFPQKSTRIRVTVKENMPSKIQINDKNSICWIKKFLAITFSYFCLTVFMKIKGEKFYKHAQHKR